MLTKAHIKLINSLQLKKYRDQHRLFIAEGPKIVEEVVHSDLKLITIFALEEWIHKLPQTFQTECHIISQNDLKKISSLKTPNQVLALVEKPSYTFDKNENTPSIILALDGINDPGNLGTIMRIADWYGIDTILCSANCVDAFHPKVVQSTMGSFTRIKVIEVDLKDSLSKLDYTVYGATLSGDNIRTIQLAQNSVLLMGSESHGISPELIPLIHQEISIPQFGGAESLNVAVATGILCDYFVR